jgi:hypothetical protein
VVAVIVVIAVKTEIVVIAVKPLIETYERIYVLSAASMI